MSNETGRVRVPDFLKMKRRAQKITVLTAYDATMARLFERAGIDALLVGDSLGMVVLGHETTLPVTLEAMIHHTSAVSRGTERALVIADMPFLTYQVSVSDAVHNAGRLLKEGGAAAVKVEGGRPMVDVVRRLVDVGIPVMGHVGVQPQSVHKLGGYLKRGTVPQDGDAILADAEALEQAGVFAVVLESISAELARTITARLSVPTIGIGAGPDCDGQVLVSYDMLGLFDHTPSFVKVYARLGEEIVTATEAYIDDVRAGRYPTAPAKAVGGRTT
ncbi:MAG TPA: 3-methyl-2-oxobutanoate hydroxymethyltransferase [Vicinamibacterales bacterium]|jgi:3-methyl-2-oxobutanoate hydroxymethyltransferase|nr:3-methyl-2-oxobutanoate hydroxymethyltransferase [Vicinamibacterales bacterium]